MAHAIEAQQKLANNDLAGARAAITAAIAERDDIVDYHLVRGRIEQASNSPGRAFDAYSNALALDATNGEALLAVAQLGLPTGNLRESLSAAERLLALAPRHTEALLVRGIHSIIRRQYDEAIEYSERILSVSPGDPGGTILKSRALYMSGRPSEALAILESASDHPAAAAALALTRLEIYRAQRLPEDLSEQFLRLRELQPDDANRHIDEANFRFKRGQRAEAHALLGRTLTLDRVEPGTAQAAVALWSEYGHHDLPVAIVDAISVDGAISARHAAARYFVDARDFGNAQRVVRSLPGSDGEGLRARLLAAMGRSSQSDALATSVLARDATNCDALIAASENALNSNRSADALRLAQQAAAECPGERAAWNLAARAYAASGRPSGAARAFAQGLDANKQDRALAQAYVDWLVGERRHREAIAVGRMLTRNAPASLSGWKLYLQLCRQLEDDCSDEAQRGLANAETLFGVDPPHGASPPNGLFGRLVER